MTQPSPQENPKQPLAPWEDESSPNDFDLSSEDTSFLGGEQFSIAQQPKHDADPAFPWQAGASSQSTTSSTPLPWESRGESRDTSSQAYRNQTPPQTPVSPPAPRTSKNLLQPKKVTSDIWQNIPIWGYIAAASAVVLGIGVVWTSSNLPKEPSTAGAQQSPIVGKNNAVGTGGTSTSSIPVRPMRSRVSPGSPSDSSTSKPGYMPDAPPAGSPKTPSSNQETMNSADSAFPSETSSEPQGESTYLSPIVSSSPATGTAAEGGPQNPFSPAYPAPPKPKPAPEPKPTLAPPPPKPQPLPPPPKVLPAILSLEGVATDGKDKLAIVRVGDQPLTAEVQVGATIEGWTVANITDETVTLTKGKQRQVLKLP